TKRRRYQPETATLRLGKPSRDRQAYAGSDPLRLRGEEWLEDAVRHLRPYARAAVLHQDAQLAVTIGGRAHHDLAPALDLLKRLMGIYQKIDNELLDLAGIGKCLRKPFVIVAGDAHAAASQAVEQEVDRIVEKRRHRNRPFLCLVLPRHGDEGAHDPCTALG